MNKAKNDAPAGHPPAVILAGDFNAEPMSEAYELLTQGRIDSARMATLSQNANGNSVRLPFAQPSNVVDGAALELRTAHQAQGVEEPRFTNYTEGFKGCLDYITFQPGSLRCVAVGELPSEAALKQDVALPNAEQPSDHLPVVCRLEFVD